MQVAELAHHPELGPMLARWHVAEWEHLYRDWDLAAAEAEFATMDTPGRVPTTYVAFAGDGRGVDDVLGSVSLIVDDELDGWRDAGPWLASLYVVPAARGRGVGRALVDVAVERARALGIADLLLFTAGQEDFYAALGWRVVARAPAGDETATVMARPTSRRAALRALATGWCRDPDVATAYSYLRPGGTPADRDRLAEPVAPGLALAGEAAWRDHPGTMHGAWFSGERAVERLAAQAGAAGVRRAVVVGAGMAGIAAGQAWRARGVAVTVLEAADRLGGRARTDTSLGGAANLGAAWMHGDEGHPMAAAAAALGFGGETSMWDRRRAYVVGRGRVADDVVRRTGARHEAFERALAAEVARGDEAAVLGPVARALLARSGASGDEALLLGELVRSEFENLYAAPLDDLSLVHCQEPFRLPGDDTLVLGSTEAAAALLADGLDVRRGARVAAVVRRGHAWSVEVDGAAALAADAVVVTVPVGALQAGRIRFEPALPAAVTASLHRIGAGRVAKVFATFDEAFWAPVAVFHVAGDPPAPLAVWVDATRTIGRPALCAFATGDHALAVEAMTEGELCALVDAVLASADVSAGPPSAPQ